VKGRLVCRELLIRPRSCSLSPRSAVNHSSDKSRAKVRKLGLEAHFNIAKHEFHHYQPRKVLAKRCRGHIVAN
jgi:hypothetical protein